MLYLTHCTKATLAHNTEEYKLLQNVNLDIVNQNEAQQRAMDFCSIQFLHFVIYFFLNMTNYIWHIDICHVLLLKPDYYDRNENMSASFPSSKYCAIIKEFCPFFVPAPFPIQNNYALTQIHLIPWLTFTISLPSNFVKGKRKSEWKEHTWLVVALLSGK